MVRVDQAGDVELEVAVGYADQAHDIPNLVDTRFAIASGTKGLTALTVMSLIGDGLVTLDTPARDLLGDDLPSIAADVTIEHLLGHTSGIGDFLDEDDDLPLGAYLMPVAAQYLATSEDYLRILDRHPTKFAAAPTSRIAAAASSCSPSSPSVSAGRRSTSSWTTTWCSSRGATPACRSAASMPGRERSPTP